MSLVKIRLTLGRTREAPDGDARHGYEFVAPLDARGHLDPAEWLQLKQHCTVRCFRPGQADKYGNLRHVGKGWRFDYEPGRMEDDEAFFKLDKHLIAPGLYLTITEEGGMQQPFKIATITPLAEAA